LITPSCFTPYLSLCALCVFAVKILLRALRHSSIATGAPLGAGDGRIDIADGLVGAGADAFLAAAARLGVVDMDVSMHPEIDFTQHARGAYVDTVPAGFAAVCIDFDERGGMVVSPLHG
jgi:hypothetical protein